jgi:HK97 family phage portal protein
MNLLARIKAAFSSEKYQSSSMAILRGQDTKRASFDNRSAVLAYRSWIFAAANLNAVAVASQPLRLYVKNRSAGTKVWRTRAASRRAKAYLGGSLEQLPSRYAMTKAAEYGDDYEVVEDSHPILTLLSKVNPYQNGFDATVLRVLFGELTGNAYVHPVLDPRLKIPVELWTMPSQYVEIMPGQKGEEFIKGYRYGATEEQKRENFYAPDEVIHFRRPNPSDLYYGMGKVEAAWGATIANEALHEMDTAFFANKARPDYLLVVKSNAHPDELERLEVSIDEKLRGSKRTGRFLTTTADIDLKPLSFPPKDLTGREQIVEEIAAVFGVPVSMLKANDPNLASATVGFASWKQTTILPLLRMDEETLNQNLLPLFGIEEDAFLAYDNPVSEDERFAFEKLRSMVAGGIMTANEARMREGLEAVEDPMADALLVNGQPLGGPAPAAPLGLASAGPDGLVGPLDRSPDLEEPPQAAEPHQNAALTFEPMPEPERKDALSDCVSGKIPTLIDEGYPQDQAVAIAYSMCREGKSIEEAASSLGLATNAIDENDVETKALGDIDTRPPQSVADNAKRALEVRARKPESERGMTAVGIARARDLANRVALSEDTIRRMVAYFERHESDKEGSTWDEQGKGWQAWNGWGGDDGFAWAKRKRDEFDRERERNSERKKKSCGCCAKNGGGDPPSKPSERISLDAIWTKAIESDEIETPHIFTKAGKDALREFDKITEREEQVGKSVGRVLDKQVRAVLEKIEKAEAPTAELAAEVETLLQSKRWRKDIVDALRPYLEDSLVAGIELGKRTLEKMAALPATFDKRGDDLKAYARTASIRFSNRAADAVNRYTAVKFSKVIGDGVANGETIPQIAERVKVWAVKDGDGERATTRRAITIARTEAQRASRSAEVEAWKSSGVVTGKTWLLAPDPCEFCEAASDAFSKNAVGLEDSFYQKGDLLFGTPDAEGNRREMLMDYEDIDGPPLHPNCRCSLQPVLDDESEAILREAEAELKAEMEAIDKQSIRENREIYERAEAEARRIMED